MAAVRQPPTFCLYPFTRTALTAEGRCYGLVTGVLLVGFIAVQGQRFHHRNVLDRQQDGLFGTLVGKLVPRPSWHNEEISLTPFKLLAVDHGVPLALEDVEHSAASMAVGTGPDAGTDPLDSAGHGPQHGAAGGRVREFHGHVVERTAIGAGQLPQRIVGLLPLVMPERGVGRVVVFPGRP